MNTSQDITSSFTCLNFRQFVVDNFCNGKLPILKEQVENIEQLDVSGKKEIHSLNGIEWFTGLKVLSCESLQLTELDISKNNLLEVINCYDNQLTFIDISHKTNLKELYCLDNKLESLDVTNSPKLERLFCGRNCLKELDLSNNPLLYDLDCAKNQLTSLDLTHNPYLEDVFMYKNKGITSIDLSNNPVLFRILINDCSLTELDLSHNPELKICCCDNNLLTEKPDISNNPYLQQAKIENSYSFSFENNLIPKPPHTVRGVGTFKYSYSIYTLETTFNGIPWWINLNVDSKEGVKRLASTVKAIWDEFPQLIEECVTFITEQHPDPDGVSGYLQGSLEIESDKTFRIGFGGGDHGAGEEYLYVGFNQKREMIKEVIFEVY